MHKRIIPRSGEELAVIGCGTYRCFDVTEKSPEYARLVGVMRAMHDAGGSVVDSSPMYGRAEAILGGLLAEDGARDKTFVATKVWTSGRDEGIAQMNQSLKLLRVSHVDLMQVHNLVDWRTQLETLRRWKQAGRTRYIGISHYDARAFADVEQAMTEHELDFLQINYSLEDRAAEKRLLPLAADRGVAVLANVPFGGGELLKKLSRNSLPSFASEIGCASWAQLLLKFVVGHPAVTCAIPGTGNPAHMAMNAAAGEGDLHAARERILAWTTRWKLW